MYAGRRLVVTVGPVRMRVSGGIVSTVKLRVAGVGSTLLAASIARIETLCAPCPSELYVLGLVHECAVPPSIAHVKLDPSSEEANLKVALAVAINPDGPAVIVVCGGVVSGPGPAEQL